MPIPLSHAKESLAFVAYEKLAGKLFEKDVFLWIMFVMQWNLLSRINNVCTMMWNRMDFVDDHLTISFAKTKKDQVGARRRIKRLFANPQNFKLCPITAIAIRLTQKDVKANHNLVYGSPKIHDTYCKGLRKFLASLDETESYKEFLGTHSLRKGAANHAIGSGVISDVLMATLLRADWDIGQTLSRYFRDHEGSDAVVGRMVAGLDPRQVTFALLPPHFHREEIKKRAW